MSSHWFSDLSGIPIKATVLFIFPASHSGFSFVFCFLNTTDYFHLLPVPYQHSFCISPSEKYLRKFMEITCYRKEDLCMGITLCSKINVLFNSNFKWTFWSAIECALHESSHFTFTFLHGFLITLLSWQIPSFLRPSQSSKLLVLTDPILLPGDIQNIIW